MKRELQAVILAAGKSTRMGNGHSKLLHRINEKTIIKSVFESCEIMEISKINVIVGYDSNNIKRELGDNCSYIHQDEQLGTGHALRMFKEANNGYAGDILVLVGDTPFITKEFIKNFIKSFQDKNLDILMATAKFDPFMPPYARIIRDDKNRITKIPEDFECSLEEKTTSELVTSQYCFRYETIKPHIKNLGSKGNKNEYYLNDIISESLKNNTKIDTFEVMNSKVVFGINSIEDIGIAENLN
jgi:bifunctional UDP-N-acetylglucosamine pyrophosphorylase / glucosamine-1-phosphate N-acetyltransferase